MESGSNSAAETTRRTRDSSFVRCVAGIPSTIGYSPQRRVALPVVRPASRPGVPGCGARHCLESRPAPLLRSRGLARFEEMPGPLRARRPDAGPPFDCAGRMPGPSRALAGCQTLRGRRRRCGWGLSPVRFSVDLFRVTREAMGAWHLLVRAHAPVNEMTSPRTRQCLAPQPGGSTRLSDTSRRLRCDRRAARPSRVAVPGIASNRGRRRCCDPGAWRDSRRCQAPFERVVRMQMPDPSRSPAGRKALRGRRRRCGWSWSPVRFSVVLPGDARGDEGAAPWTSQTSSARTCSLSCRRRPCNSWSTSLVM
jgi:hypothetical protein